MLNKFGRKWLDFGIEFSFKILTDGEFDIAHAVACLKNIWDCMFSEWVRVKIQIYNCCLQIGNQKSFSLKMWQTFGMAPNSYSGELNSTISQMTRRSVTVRHVIKNNFNSTWFRGTGFKSGGRKRCSVKCSFSKNCFLFTIWTFGFSSILDRCFRSWISADILFQSSIKLTKTPFKI